MGPLAAEMGEQRPGALGRIAGDDVGHGRAPGEGGLGAEVALALDAPGQRLALEVLHHEVVAAIVRAPEVRHRDHVGVHDAHQFALRLLEQVPEAVSVQLFVQGAFLPSLHQAQHPVG